MRWGGTSSFVWVRPLRRIVCLLDGAVVPFDLRDGEDDGHGLASGDLTEGHRFHAPGAFAVCVLRRLGGEAARPPRAWSTPTSASGSSPTASPDSPTERQVSVVDDPGLLDEVAGLVEWPVPLLGRIDDAYMDLPAEVRQVSMRVNQRYFAFRNADGSAAPYFGFVANIEPADGGAASIAGNERVLRARFADARHFWDLDRKARLEIARAAAGSRHLPRQARHRRASGCAGWSAWPRRSPRWSAPARRWPATPRGWPRPTWSPAWSASSPNCRA